MKKMTWWVLFLVLFGGLWEAHAQIYADMVLFNGKVLTVDSEDPADFTIAQAIAVYDDKIVAVGSNEEVLRSAGPQTRKLDMRGMNLIPGFIDTHSHIHSYSIDHFGEHLRRPDISLNSKDEALADLKKIAATKKPGEWIEVGFEGGGGGSTGVPPSIVLLGQLTAKDLDTVTPNNPVYINLSTAENDALLNTKALQLLGAIHSFDQFGPGGVRKGPDGLPDGYVHGDASFTVYYELLPKQPPEVMAPLYKKEMEEWLAMGISTVSTRLAGDHVSTYALLDSRGEMPIRMAYSTEFVKGARDVERLFRRLGNLQGHGTDRLWMTGVSPVNVDWSACTATKTPTYLPEGWKPENECLLTDPAYNHWAVIMAAARHGYKISGMHMAGEKSMDLFLDALEEASKESPVAGKRFAVDHVRFLTQEQAERAKKFGVLFSISPKNIDGTMRRVADLYGREIAGDVVSPARRIIDVGLKPVVEIDAHRYSFLELEVMVTRKDSEGQPWGPQQRIDRREALYAFTRWAAEYVLREKQLGSIEKGKWADLTLIDRDYLTVPEDQISEIKVMMGIVGGKIGYTEPNFARAMDLPQAGFRDRSPIRQITSVEP